MVGVRIFWPGSQVLGAQTSNNQGERQRQWKTPNSRSTLTPHPGLHDSQVGKEHVLESMRVCVNIPGVCVGLHTSGVDVLCVCLCGCR